nr:hypothetical protein [Tanacetum cinerariifolium]
MTSITSFCELACQVAQKKLEEKQIEEERAAKAKYWKLPVCYDDDDDEERSDSLDDNITFGLPPFSAITPNEPVLSTEEPDNSLNQIEDLSESIKEFSSINDNSFSIDDINYVEASPPDFELVNSEVMEIVIPKVGGIDDDILLTINHDVLREKLLNVNFLIYKIKALNANPTPSPDCKTKSDSYEFTDELIPFISAPEYDCFRFKVEPNSRDFTKDVVENMSPTKEPQVLTVLPTHPTL